MNLSTSALADIISSNYDSLSASFSKFSSSEYLWNECMKTVHNPVQMNFILMCNDKLSIPPMATFLDTSKELTGPVNLREQEALAAFWRFLFLKVFAYNKFEEVAIDVKGARRAQRYLDCSQNWNII